MREWYRDIVYGLTLLIASFTAYLTWRGPQAADPPVVQSVATHPIGGLIVVGVLFLLAGVLNVAPLLSRLLPLRQTKPTLKQRTIRLADELFGLLHTLGPEPPHPLSDKSGTIAGQEQTFNAYFEWQRNAYHSYIAHFKNHVIQIDHELAASKIFTKLDEREIDPPKNNAQVGLRKIAETLLLTAYHMPN